VWLVSDGGVAPFEGDLDEYRQMVLRNRRESERADASANAATRPTRAHQRRAAAEKRSELAPLKRQIANLEADVLRLSARIAEIDGALADPKLYERDPTRSAALAKERADKAATLAAAEEQWLAASAAYESALAE
jgi:ATP-binding cassette subfamily F protein 3